MRIFYIITIGILSMNLGCKKQSATKEAAIEHQKYERADFKNREDVQRFFLEYKNYSFEEISQVLWKFRDKTLNGNILSVWYTKDDPPFLILEESSEPVLGGFTLRFKDNKFIAYDLDFR